MTLATLKEEARAEFDKDFPCINTSCDNNGSIPHQVYEDEWEAEQCQYCFEVRFPQLASIEKNIDKTYHATKEEVRNLVPKKRENFPSSESSYDRGFRRGYDMARGDLRSAIDALEDTTTSPNP